jgi:hypothetical protein
MIHNTLMSVLSWRGKPLSRLALITIVILTASTADKEKDNSVKWLFSSPVFKSHARTCVKFDLYASDNIWVGRNGAPYGSKLGGRPPFTPILACMVCQLSPQAGGRVCFRWAGNILALLLHPTSPPAMSARRENPDQLVRIYHIIATIHYC